MLCAYIHVVFFRTESLMWYLPKLASNAVAAFLRRLRTSFGCCCCWCCCMSADRVTLRIRRRCGQSPCPIRRVLGTQCVCVYTCWRVADHQPREARRGEAGSLTTRSLFPAVVRSSSWQYFRQTIARDRWPTLFYYVEWRWLAKTVRVWN